MSSSELIKSNLSLQRPDFVGQGEIMGLDDVRQYIIPPRLKIIQPQAKAPFSELFDKGDVVVLPHRLVMAPVVKTDKGKPSDKGTPFHFVPLFFFPEWYQWNPIQASGLNSIRDRTFDANSDLARKSRNKDTWFEKCPEFPEYNIRNCEHLNFVVMVLNDPVLNGIPCVVSFARGGYRSGSTLLSLLQVRNAHIFECQFEAQTSFRQNESGEWYGLDCSNPSAESNISPWIKDAVQRDELKKLHIEYKEAHAKALLRVERDDEDDVEDAATVNAGSEKRF